MSCSPKRDAPVEVCGACEGVAPSTPLRVNNRPGLSALSYRIGSYPQFKQSLLAGLSSSRYPALAGLRTRHADDYTLGLIDAVACAADVLSFYQERLANESYLRTATERVSLQEMGKLIGYRLRPGAAAETWLAFALESPRTPPPGLPPEPGAFVTGIPTALTLAAGLKVQSVPGPDEKPQIFETVEPLAARPEWNAMRALSDDDVVPGFGATHTWLAGLDTQLKVGDALLFVGAEFQADTGSERWDLRLLSAVQPDADGNRTRVAWQEPLGSVSPLVHPAAAPTVYALRQRAAVFGHNAPDWPSMSDEYKAAYLGLESRRQLTQAQRREWPQFDIFGPGNSGGAQIVAHVPALAAAEALLEGLQADAMAVARQGLTSMGTLGLSTGALAQHAASLPGSVGRSSIEALKLVPGAVGVVSERVMEPVRWLVDTAVGGIQPFLRDLGESAKSTARVVNAVAGAVRGGSASDPFGQAPTDLTEPTWPPSRGADLPPLFQGNELKTLQEKLDARIGDIGNELNGIAQAGRGVRDAHAGVIEAAFANVAAAVYTARMQAELKISPQLPYATTESVCEAALAASHEAMSALPDLVVGAALADPRPAVLMLASLAPWDEADASADTLALRSMALANDANLAAVGLRQALHNPDLADSVRAGQVITQRLDQAAGMAASTVFTSAVERMRVAAASGVMRAHQALVLRSDRLLAGRAARLLWGRTPSTVSLDRPYAGVLPHSFAVLQSPEYTELFRVTQVAEASRAEFGISGKSMMLTLAGEHLSLFAHAVRETTVLVQSQALARARSPIAAPVSGGQIVVAGAVYGLVKDRRVIVQGLSVASGERVAHQALLVDVVVGSDRTTLHITPPLPVALQRGSVVVFGNVALATHGDTGAQILGAGDASQAFQRFELKRLPLTYRSAPNESGIDSELSIRVGNIEWIERPTLFGAGPNDRVYTLHTDEQSKDWVVFGDGLRGARLPSGVNNVRASYRQGLGQGGNVQADQLTQLMTRPMGLKGVSNPAAAAGGTDAEPASQARRSMPLGTRTLGRAVSLRDYEDFALAFTGIAKAQARVLHLSSGSTVAITVAGQGGDAVTAGGPIWQNLWGALKANGDPHVQIVLLSYQASHFRLGLKVKRDPAYAIEPLLVAVQAALRAHFAFDERALGQPVLQSEVVAVAHRVPGVVAIDLDFLYGGSSPFLQVLKSKQTRLLAGAMRVHNGVAKPAELLTLHPAAFERLEEMP